MERSCERWQRSGAFLVLLLIMGSGAHGGSIELASPNPQAGGRFGDSVAWVPDITGDGIADVAVGAYLETSDGSPSGAGRAHLFNGSTGEFIRTLRSPSEKDDGHFGRLLSGVPDLNGDGFGELLVSTGEHSDSGIRYAGSAYLFNGRTGGLMHSFHSPNPALGGYFGRGLAAGDLTGDGRPELVIGAYQEDFQFMGAGRVYVYDATSYQIIRELVSPTAELAGKFGCSVAVVPDLNGDGIDDLAVGANDEDPGDSPYSAGRAHIFAGGSWQFLRTLSSPNEQEAGGFGSVVEGLEDVTGDGRGDVVVAAPSEDGEAGVVYVFNGDTGGFLHRLVSSHRIGKAFFGNDTAAVRDINESGSSDIAAGVYRENKTYLFDGDSGEIIDVIDLYGRALAGAPDLDGDGLGDLILGTGDGLYQIPERAFILTDLLAEEPTPTLTPTFQGTPTPTATFVPGCLSRPEGLRALPGVLNVRLEWWPNPETEIQGYYVYRSDSREGPFMAVNESPFMIPEYLDREHEYRDDLYYYVTAVGEGGCESARSDIAQATVGDIRVWMPNVQAPPGTQQEPTTVRVPINITNGYAKFWRLDFHVTYPGDLLEPAGFEQTTLTKDFVFEEVRPASNEIQFNTLPYTPFMDLAGEGHLLDMLFTLNPEANIGESGTIRFSDDGVGVDIYAIVWGISFQLFLEESDLDACVVTVNETGFLGDLDADGAVTAADSDLAAQSGVSLKADGPAASEAGDINGDGKVDTGDAVLILRMASGESINPGTSEVPKASAAAVGSYMVQVGSTTAGPGDSAVVPVQISLPEGGAFAGGEIQINFNESVLFPVAVDQAAWMAGQGYRHATNLLDPERTPGTLRVSLFRWADTTVSDDYIYITFQVSPDATGGSTTPLVLSLARLVRQYGNSVGWDSEIELVNGSIAIAEAGGSPTPTETATPTATATPVPTPLSTQTPTPLVCDLNGDGVVDWEDLLIFLHQWQKQHAAETEE